MTHLDTRPATADRPHTPALRFLRYVLAGGLVAVALLGIAEAAFGIPARVQYDVYGAIAGFAIIVVGAKLFRFV